MGASGKTTVDFGSFPGGSDASIAVTGQTGIITASLVEAWILPADTTDHLSDEHMLETFEVFAGNIIAGTGFTIYAVNTSQVNEPLTPDGVGSNNVTLAGGLVVAQGLQQPLVGGRGTRIYGKWTVGWVWN